jgi:hypothetical protein
MAISSHDILSTLIPPRTLDNKLKASQHASLQKKVITAAQQAYN